jgi:hypothetical protein
VAAERKAMLVRGRGEGADAVDAAVRAVHVLRSRAAATACEAAEEGEGGAAGCWRSRMLRDRGEVLRAQWPISYWLQSWLMSYSVTGIKAPPHAPQPDLTEGHLSPEHPS